MEASRGKKLSTTNRGSAARKVAVVGKENICPSTVGDPLKNSRSPLPEGFPRAPLQDITHVLSPINVPLHDGDSTDLGLFKPLRKRPKCLAETEAPASTSSEFHSDSVEWRGLIICEASAIEAQVKGGSTEVHGVQVQPVEQGSAVSVVTIEASTSMEQKEFDIELMPRGTAEGENRGHIQAGVVVEAKSLREAERKATEHIHSGRLELPSRSRSLRSGPKRPQSDSPGSSARAGLRSAQEKLKMSSLMKFR